MDPGPSHTRLTIPKGVADATRDTLIPTLVELNRKDLLKDHRQGDTALGTIESRSIEVLTSTYKVNLIGIMPDTISNRLREFDSRACDYRIIRAYFHISITIMILATHVTDRWSQKKLMSATVETPLKRLLAMP